MLSNRKLKAFNRTGGAYLVLPWPADLPTPRPEQRDVEVRATQAQHLAALRMVAPITQAYGLIHLATMVSHLLPPTHWQPRVVQPLLLVHLVTPRYERATKPGCRAPAQWSDAPTAAREPDWLSRPPIASP